MERITLEVMGPTIPVEQEYGKQRYFVRGEKSLSSARTTLSRAASVQVYRSAINDHAQLKVEAIQARGGEAVCASSSTVFMSSGNLRDLAARLLDAAVDLERFPSAVLLSGDLRQGALSEC